MFTPYHFASIIGFRPTGDLGAFTIYSSLRQGTVWFIKSPPLEPPSVRQLHYRNLFRSAAAAWRTLTPEKRNDWLLAARRAYLSINGYNLFVWYQLKRDRATLATVERVSRLTLVP